MPSSKMITCSECGGKKTHHCKGLCKKCYMVEYNRKWDAKNPTARYEAHLKNTFDLTLAEYDEMLESQGGGCAICGATPEENGKRLAVDHNHGTGANRGLLCDHCNRGLGHFKDNPLLLTEAARYILLQEEICYSV